MQRKEGIDFVIIWVDESDPEWLNEKSKYTNIEDVNYNPNNVRYRDYGTLKYWFRSVEKYAPWVRMIHFVTCVHIPSWLNLDNPKLHLVKHSDFIPQEFLPTFSSHPIELNLYRIKGLSERFVYFNDDMFVNAPVGPDDFFKDGLPRDIAIRNIPLISKFGHIDLNNLIIIGKHFDFIKTFRTFPWKYLNWRYGLQNFRFFFLMPWPIFLGFKTMHVANSYLKSTFVEVLKKEYDTLRQTCLRKFRDERDVNQWVFRYWQLAQGKFSPRDYNFSELYCISNETIGKIVNDIVKGKHKLICINDNQDLSDISFCKERIIDAFESNFPQKSTFEV